MYGWAWSLVYCVNQQYPLSISKDASTHHFLGFRANCISCSCLTKSQNQIMISILFDVVNGKRSNSHWAFSLELCKRTDPRAVSRTTVQCSRLFEVLLSLFVEVRPLAVISKAWRYLKWIAVKRLYTKFLYQFCRLFSSSYIIGTHPLTDHLYLKYLSPTCFYFY